MAREAAVHIVGPVRLHLRGRFWNASYTTEGGRVRESLKVTNLKVAEKKAREIADLIERGEYATLEDRKAQKSRTFADFLDEFGAKYKGWNENTRKGTKSILKKIKAEWGHLPLTGINARMIESFLARRMDHDGISKATANRCSACLKTVFKMAVRWGMVAHSPADSVRMLKEDPKIPQALSEKEVELLLDKLPEYARVVVLVATETGMRASELFGLQWSDIDFEKKRITVRYHKGYEFRVIPMTNLVHDTLAEQLKKGMIPYVLPGPEGKQLTSIKGILWRKGEKAGIGKIHMHMFRHTFATRLRERGVPLDRIKELLGHKTMVMTLRYAKASPTQLEEAIEALNRPQIQNSDDLPNVQGKISF